MHLVHSYHLLDSSFVDSWNESSDTEVSTVTYTVLQKQLNLPHPSHLSLTDIQKADILVTKQWLRLIVWQSSMRRGLLSSTAEDESMTFRYPIKIAHSLLNVISSLPTTSIEVHGMGIFEKIFEIGNTFLDVLDACGNNIPQEIYGVTKDPFQMFIKTLSQTPNSQKQYANMLLAKAAEKPTISKFTDNLVCSLDDPILGPVMMDFDTGAPYGDILPPLQPRGWRGSRSGQFGDARLPPLQPRQFRGSIVGEIGEDGSYTAAEESSDEEHTPWTDNTILISDNDISVPGVWV